MSDRKIEFFGYSEIRVIVNNDVTDAGSIFRNDKGVIVWRPSRYSLLTVEELQSVIDVMKQAHSSPMPSETKLT